MRPHGIHTMSDSGIAYDKLTAIPLLGKGSQRAMYGKEKINAQVNFCEHVLRNPVGRATRLIAMRTIAIQEGVLYVNFCSQVPKGHPSSIRSVPVAPVDWAT